MEPLREYLKAERGRAKALAEKLGVFQSSISQWATGTSKVPPERVLEIEEITGVSRHALRPDIFGPPPSPTEDAQQASAA